MPPGHCLGALALFKNEAYRPANVRHVAEVGEISADWLVNNVNCGQSLGTKRPLPCSVDTMDGNTVKGCKRFIIHNGRNPTWHLRGWATTSGFIIANVNVNEFNLLTYFTEFILKKKLSPLRSYTSSDYTLWYSGYINHFPSSMQ